MLFYENAESLSSHQVFLNNLLPLFSTIKRNLSSHLGFLASIIDDLYQSSTEITLLETSFNKSLSPRPKVYLCLRDRENNQEIFIGLDTKLARKLITKKLTTVLLDDSHGELFSGTEKGIFSFIVAEILWKLRGGFTSWSRFELMSVSEDKNPTAQVALDFSFSFQDECYLVEAHVPPSYFYSVKKPAASPAIFLGRLGHLTDFLCFSLKTISMDLDILSTLSFGDLLLFDSCEQKFDHGLVGNLSGRWHNLMIYGYLSKKDQAYQLVFEGIKPFEEQMMETIDVTHSHLARRNSTEKVLSIAENLRVLLSIELSRIPLTLKDLAKLSEGEIIDLKRNISDPLEMVLDGKVIGYCQPVQIDGRLGIRVIEILQE